MKTIGKYYALAVAAIMTIGSIAFVSCNKEKENNYTNGHFTTNENATKSITLSDAQRLHYAQLLATKMSQYPNSYRELNYAISVVNSYGVDEHLAFFDILSTQESKFLLPNIPISNLRNALVETGIAEDCGLTYDNYYANLQLYWPYHDDWDDTTTPVIIFIPINENATTVTGYRCYPGGTAEPIPIDESSITKYGVPCIIINECEFRYNEYPNFKEGEHYNNGFTWGRISDSDNIEPYINNVQTGHDTITYASSYKLINSKHQYDNWLAGGSEFFVTLARVKEPGIHDTAQYVFELTRKEIENGTPVDIEMIISHNWENSFGDIYYYFVEHDDWGFTGSFSVTLSLGGSTINAQIDTNSTDDFIASDYIPRGEFITKCMTGNNQYIWGLEKFLIRTIQYSEQ